MYVCVCICMNSYVCVCVLCMNKIQIKENSTFISLGTPKSLDQ